MAPQAQASLSDQATFLRRRQGTPSDAGNLSLGRWSCACGDADGVLQGTDLLAPLRPGGHPGAAEQFHNNAARQVGVPGEQARRHAGVDHRGGQQAGLGEGGDAPRERCGELYGTVPPVEVTTYAETSAIRCVESE